MVPNEMNTYVWHQWLSWWRAPESADCANQPQQHVHKPAQGTH
jgi:hypothetical protein